MTTAPTVLMNTVRNQWRLVVGSTTLLMSWQACESLVPVVIGSVIDRAITRHDGRELLVWIGVLAGLFLVLSLSFRFGSRLSERASERAAHRLRVQVARVVLDPHSRPDSSRPTGETVSVASSDTRWVGLFCAVVPFTCAALVSILVTAVALLRISVPLGLLVLIGAPPLLAAVHLLGTPLERRSGAEQAHAAEAAGLATDLVTGLRVLKGIGGEPAAAGRYQVASRRSLVATLRAARAESTYHAATLLLTMCFLALVALVGGRFAAQGLISVGDLVAAVGLAQFLLGPLSQLSSTGARLARARASAGRVVAVLDTPRHEYAANALPAPTRGALVVDNGELHIAADAGEILGIAADAEDAATLVDVLTTAQTSTEAAVRVDDVAIGRLGAEAARGTLLVAQHDAHLFAETVLDNIQASASDPARVKAAILAADADQVADMLPNGLDTVLAERGRSLSGGQRQRVALARALAAAPTVLVLHDPTTAVDTVTEARIAVGLREVRAGRTTVVIATSPALLAACDRVLLVQGGVVRAEGPHSQLATIEPAYQDLVLS